MVLKVKKILLGFKGFSYIRVSWVFKVLRFCLLAGFMLLLLRQRYSGFLGALGF